MSLEVSGISNSNTQFEPLESGVYNAVCTAIAAVGRVKNPVFNTISNKVYIKFEVEKENGETGEIWMNETQSIKSKSRLGTKLVSWRQKDFSPEELRSFKLVNILGVPAQIVVSRITTKAGKPFSSVDNILPAKKKLTASETWTYDVDDPAQTNYDKLPKFIQTVIENNKELNGSVAPAQTMNVAVEDNLLDVPF